MDKNTQHNPNKPTDRDERLQELNNKVIKNTKKESNMGILFWILLGLIGVAIIAIFVIIFVRGV